MEKKRFSYEVKEVSQKGIVTFYANKFGNTDSDNDIMQQGAFIKTLSENFKRIRHLLNHNELIGVPLSIKEDSFGLLCNSQLILGRQKGLETFETYKAFAEAGNSLEHSIGFNTIKSDIDVNGVRIIKEVKLFDVTTMDTWGANEDTPMVSLKSETDVLKAISTFENLLKGRFTDEKLELFEKKLNEIKSLVTQEPPPSTPDYKPVLQLLNKSKLLNYGS